MKLISVLPLILFLNAFTLIPVVFGQESTTSISFCKNDIESNIDERQTNLIVDFAINEIIEDTLTTFATLTNNENSPIVGAPILFYVSNEDDQEKWIGHAITDCYGVAILRFERDQSGSLVVTAKFEGGNGFSENESNATLELKSLAEDKPLDTNWKIIEVTTTLIIVISAAVIGAYFIVIENKKNKNQIRNKT